MTLSVVTLVSVQLHDGVLTVHGAQPQLTLTVDDAA